MSCGIYKIENKINGKIYIGQSIGIEHRWQKHLAANDDFVIHKALKKYGKENFDFSIIEECNSLELDNKEKYWIDYYNSLVPNGYNMIPGGSQGLGLAKGKSVQQYDLKGNFIAEYPSAHQADYATEINYSSICACCRGEKPYTKQYQWKYSNSEKKIVDISQDIKVQSETPVWQYDLNENFIREYKNFSEAAMSISSSKSALCNCLKGKTSSCAGYKWSYANSPILKRSKKSWNGKKIGQFDKENNLIEIYNSAVEAYQKTGISNTSIGKVCNGKAKTAGNFIWKFI